MIQTLKEVSNNEFILKKYYKTLFQNYLFSYILVIRVIFSCSPVLLKTASPFLSVTLAIAMEDLFSYLLFTNILSEYLFDTITAELSQLCLEAEEVAASTSFDAIPLFLKVLSTQIIVTTHN